MQKTAQNSKKNPNSSENKGKNVDFKCIMHKTAGHLTFVIPRAPTFSLYEVVPFPVPQAPANRQPIPSIPIPLLMACFGGGGAPDNLAQAW